MLASVSHEDWLTGEEKTMATDFMPAISVAKVPKGLIVFAVGAFGGIAPTLLRIGVDLSQQNKSVSEINSSVLVGMAIFAMLGGAVAAIWNEVDLKKVFYLGLGLPSLITVVTTTATMPQRSAEAEVVPKSAAVAAMNWQPVWFQSTGSGKVRMLLPAEVGYNGAVATFYRSDNSSVNIPIRAGVDISTPDRSVAVAVSSPVAQSDRVALGPSAQSSTVVIKFTAQKDPYYGLLYAVGAHSKPFKLIASSVSSDNIVPRSDNSAKYSERIPASVLDLAHRNGRSVLIPS